MPYRTIIYRTTSLCPTTTILSGTHTITKTTHEISLVTTTIHIPCYGKCSLLLPPPPPPIQPDPSPPLPTEIVTSIMCPLGSPAVPVTPITPTPPLFTGSSSTGNFSGNATANLTLPRLRPLTRVVDLE